MFHSIVTDICQFLISHRPDLSHPWLIILGGSQTVDGGLHRTKDSDFDVLALFQHAPEGTSYSFKPAVGRNHYDLMIHDTSTLAHHIRQGQQDARGTLLHIASLGKIIHDPTGTGEQFQDKLKAIHYAGPYVINGEDMESELRSLSSNLYHLRKSGIAYEANVAGIVNRIGRLALHFSGHWTSNGKIGGRFLEQQMPEFSCKLKEAFQKAMFFKNTSELDVIISNSLPAMFFQIDPFTKPGTANKTEEPIFVPNPKNLAEATHAARISLDSFAHYIQGHNAVSYPSAVTWAHVKLNTQFNPLSQERFQNKPMEYLMALGRAIGGLADIRLSMTDKTPSRLTPIERIQAMFESEKELQNAFSMALAGDSSGLQEYKEATLEEIGPQSLFASERPSPSHHRLEPEIYGLKTI